MLQLERFRSIEELLSKKNHLKISELEKHLNVSRATIYRDLKDLDKQGKIRIVRGGIAKPSSHELPYIAKRAINTDEKRRIAKAAAGYIMPNQTIFLDSSTTVNEMTSYLLERKDIQVITNDLNIASDLTISLELKVYVIGGLIRPGFYTLTGYLAQNNLSKMHADIAFLSCDAIGLRDGCMLTNDEEVDIKREVIKRSSRVIILCDHSKFSGFAFLSFCNLNQVERVITGKELNDSIYSEYTENGVCLEKV